MRPQRESAGAGVEPPGRASARDRLYAAAALALSGIHFASFFDAKLPIYTDIRYFVYFAWRIAEGAVPHLDLFDNKTFGSHFAAALFYRAGSGLGIDELSTIRAGCLAVCALAGMGVFVVFRRIGNGSQVVGLLGLLAYLSFGFIGTLSAIGNFPKLFMPALALSAALLVLHRRWFWAGLMGALAFMDWQVGALVGGVAVLAALFEHKARWRAVGLVVAGGVAGILPLALYYFWNGALDSAVEQTIMAAIARSEASLAIHTPWSRLDKMWRLAGQLCPEQLFLFIPALAGLAIVPFWWWPKRKDPAGRLVFPLATYHYGILAFSLVDFQRFPDFFLVLQALAFFLGMTCLVMYREVARLLAVPADPTASSRRVFVAVAIALAVLAARPAWLRPEIVIRTGPVTGETTLADQQEIAREIALRTRGKKLVLLGSSELLYLMRYVNPLPLAYFDQSAFSVYGLPGESQRQAMGRVALSVDPDAVILQGARKFAAARRTRVDDLPELPGFRGEIITTQSGSYGAILYSRVTPASQTR